MSSERSSTSCAARQGRFAVGDEITLADCFLVPQVRNALLAGIDLPDEFPNLSRVFDNAVAVPEVAGVLEAAGGIVQPLAFDADKFEVYADLPGAGRADG